MISLFVIAISESEIISPVLAPLPLFVVVVLLLVPLPAAQHVGVTDVDFRVQENESRFVGPGKVCNSIS